MTDQSIGFADLVDEAGLSRSWKRDKGRLSKFLRDLGLKEGEISQTLYIFAIRSMDPEKVFSELEADADHEHWAKLIAGRDDGSSIVLAFPVSKNVRLDKPGHALDATLSAFFIEAHSRLVAWWLINAWRSKQLSEATWLLADSLQTIPAAACARALVETAATV